MNRTPIREQGGKGCLRDGGGDRVRLQMPDAPYQYVQAAVLSYTYNSPPGSARRTLEPGIGTVRARRTDPGRASSFAVSPELL